MEVGLITCGAMPGLHGDDRHLLAALRQAGLEAAPLVWEDPHQDWSVPRLCVIRSAWDYCWRREQFVSWAVSAARQTELWNSAAMVRWNTHKSYLCDLASRGIPTVPTLLLSRGSRVRLKSTLEERGWSDAVIKAAVAQSGRYALLARRDQPEKGQAHLDRLLPHEDMLLQPFVASVPEEGEVSLIYIEGEFIHAVRKRAPPGDFRVHDDYGGSVTLEAPPAGHIELGVRALASLGEPTLYARVDLVNDSRGEPMIMEFELVEPELFFRHSTEAVSRMLDAISRRLQPDFKPPPSPDFEAPRRR